MRWLAENIGVARFISEDPFTMLKMARAGVSFNLDGIWGGNITNENIALKHYMQVTWVSRPIPEDRPSEPELFGEFYNSEIF